MRCSRCGNDNPETNRFCGMCGATLLQPPSGGQERPARATSASGSHAAGTSAATQPQNPPPQSPPPGTTSSPDTPTISGPSFLGLNDPPPKPARSKGSLSIDPGTAQSSRSLDYLLEDEEESRGGAGKYFVIVLAALLLLVFGYMRWKSEGFPWLTSSAKPSAAAPAPDSGDSNPNPPAAAPTTPATSSPAPSPAPSGSEAPANSAASSQPSSAGNAVAPANPGSSAAQQPAPAQAAPTQPNAPSGGAPHGGATANSAPGAGGDENSDDDNSAPVGKGANDGTDNSVPNAAPAAKPEPPPKPRPAVPKDPVVEARKYLYGLGGTPQSCDRGMRLLKPLADKADAKAMIEMGALYSAGLCTPRDLPTAYRWFALALRKDPDNQPLQADLQKLWGEMTQPERQLAIRLSQ